MGFTLTEIESLLRLRTRRSCRATRELAATKLQIIDGRIRELLHLRVELAELITSCDSNSEDSTCPVIERLALPSRQTVQASSPMNGVPQ